MLTDRQIRSAVEAIHTAGGERFLSDDTGTRGTGRLMLRIRGKAGGAKPTAEWIVRWKRDGARSQTNIGRWPDMPLAEARRKYEGHRQTITAGGDPKAIAPAGSVAQLFEAYVAASRAAGREGYAREVERALLTSAKGAAADAIGRDRPAKEVTPGEIADVLAPVFKRAPAMAGHLRAYLAAAWSYGIKHDTDFTAGHRRVLFGITTNPVAPLRTVPAKARTRVLTPEELRAWWRGFPDHADERTVLVLRLTLLCCARVTEAIRLLPEHIEPGRWTKAATKNGKPHASPLVGLAQEAADRLAALGGGDMTIPAVGKAVLRWHQDTGGEPWQPRDLRRTARTMLAEAGEDAALLDLHFNHGTGAGVVRKHYDHAIRWPERVALAERWEARIRAIVS